MGKANDESIPRLVWNDFHNELTGHVNSFATALNTLTVNLHNGLLTINGKTHETHTMKLAWETMTMEDKETTK